jgi:O-antigen/teichoic acid export membrane protein
MLRVLAGGSLCNCMVWLSYLYLLAKGNTRFTLIQNTITSIIIVPLLLWLTKQYGAYGASFSWLIINAGILFIGMPVFHKYYMKNELARWYIKVIGPPLIISGLLAFGAKRFQMQILPHINIIYFGGLLLIILAIYWIIIPELRHFLFRLKFKFRGSL